MANYPLCPVCGATGPVGSNHTFCACVSLAAFHAYIKPPEEMISMTDMLSGDMDRTEKPATPPLAITAEVLVPMERITNCIVGALEGGSTYWLRGCDYIVTVGDSYSSPRYADDHFWNDGGRVKLTYDNPEPGEDEDSDQASKEIGIAELKAGLSLMAAKAPRHFGDLMAENDDAVTHDVFIQCVLFGEIVYG